jgi:hypothetical protein
LKTVLIVDDKECIRTSMAVLFEEFGYSVRLKTDAPHYVRSTSGTQTFFLPISDARHVRTRIVKSGKDLFPAIKVIATSGSFCGNEVPPGILADAFYAKGSSVSALLHILRELPQVRCRLPESLAAGD